MAKRQSFLDKTQKKKNVNICPVCSGEIQYVKHVRAVKSETGSWKFRTVNTGICKCNEKEAYK